MSSFWSLGLMCRSLSPVSPSPLEGPKWMTSSRRAGGQQKRRDKNVCVLSTGKACWLLKPNTCGQEPHLQKEMNVLWDMCVCLWNLNMLSGRSVTGSDSFITYQIVVFKGCLMSKKLPCFLHPVSPFEVMVVRCHTQPVCALKNRARGSGPWGLARGRPAVKIFQVTVPRAAPLGTE